MRAVAIVFVVWGHNYQPQFLFFPAFYFHISLFFFISGYFFRPQVTIKDKFKYFLKKTRNLLVPYLAFNLFFGLLTAWLKTMNIRLGEDLNFASMFILPFSGGDQFVLYLAAWFLFNLYFISIFAGLVFQKNIKVNIGIVVFSFIMMLFFLNNARSSSSSMWTIFMTRSIFGFCFVGLGYLFHVFESRISKIVVKPITVVILYMIVNVLNANFGNISYSIVFGNVSNDLVFIPIITSLCIILIVYTFAFYVTKILKHNSFIYEIGQYSFSIMIGHLTFFLLVNFMLYKLSLIPYSALSDVYFRYNVEKLWFVYQLPAIILPVLIMKVYNLAKLKILSISHLDLKG